MNKPVAWMYRVNNSFNTFSTIEPPDDAYDEGTLVLLYTKDQLEEARKLGMQQERALWNLSESTQELESFDRTASHMAGEYVAHKELNDGGEPVKNATYWKRQYNEMSAANDRLKSALYHANEQIKYLESNPVKELHLSLQKEKETGELLAVTYTDDEHRIVEVLWQRPPVKALTDEEIEEFAYAFQLWQLHNPDKALEGIMDFARAILRKAQEK